MIQALQTAEVPSECFRFESEWVETLPELFAAKRVTQRNEQTVFDHTLRVLDKLESRRVVCQLAALFHDLGKAFCPHVGKKKLAFTGHEQASSILARQRMMTWEVDPWTIDRVCRAIENHMIDLRVPFSRRAIRNFIARVGWDNVHNWYVLRRADAASYGERPLTDIEHFYVQVGQEMRGPVVKPEDLTLTEADLEAFLGLGHTKAEFVIRRLAVMVNNYQCENDPRKLMVVAKDLVG